MSDVFARRDALERRKGALEEKIRDLRKRLGEAQAEASSTEVGAARVEHEDGFMDWAGQGWIGGMFSPILVLLIGGVIALGECAAGDWDKSPPRHWLGSVIASTDPRAPLAARCFVVIDDGDEGCRVVVECGDDRNVVADERATCNEIDIGTGEDSEYVIVAFNAGDTLAIRENLGHVRLGPKNAPRVVVVVHDFTIDPEEIGR